MKWLIKVGVVLIVLGFAAFFYADAGHPLPIYKHLDNFLIFLGLGLVAIYFLIVIFMLLFSHGVQVSRKGRCVRCGKKIPKGEVYCEFHRAQVANEFLSHKNEMRDMHRR